MCGFQYPRHCNCEETQPPPLAGPEPLRYSKRLLGLECLLISEEDGHLELVSEGQEGGQATHVILRLKG